MTGHSPTNSDSMRAPTRWLVIVLAAVAVLVGSLTFGVWAWAQTPSTAVPRLVPYQGNLERNGALLDVPADIAFSLFANATGGSALWREAHVDVPVTSGRFTVLLGIETRIPLEVMNAPEVYLEVEVDGSVLQGRQRFLANPAAVAASHGVPPGAIMAFAGENAPAGWLLCDGSEVGRAEFASLFEATGAAHGAGNGTTTFSLPDYRGRFLRGVDRGMGRDPNRANRAANRPGGNVGDAVGSVQGGATALPEVGFETTSDGDHSHAYADNSGWPPGGVANTQTFSSARLEAGPEDVARVTATAGAHTHSLTGGDSETRPVNSYVNWIIKY